MNPQQAATNTPPRKDQGLSLPPVDPTATPIPDPTPQVAPGAPAAKTTKQDSTTTNSPTAAPQTASDDAAPMIADDTDLIEKEWVEKAKQLVDKTKNDPYNQNKEISKFKANYIKKRYNKDVQLSND